MVSMSLMALLLSSAGVSSIRDSMKRFAFSLPQALLTMGWTSFGSSMARSLMENRNDGQDTWKGATRKVTVFEDQTLRSKRVSAWSGVML